MIRIVGCCQFNFLVLVLKMDLRLLQKFESRLIHLLERTNASRMNSNSKSVDLPTAGRTPMRFQFDHERLDVYQLEPWFVGWVSELLTEVKAGSGIRTAEVSDQLDRASLSALLNTAEGNGKRQRQQHTRFFDDARGSVTECAACLDAVVAKHGCESDRISEGKDVLARIYAMLTKLVDRFDEAPRLKEGSVEYVVGGGFEGEEEDEGEREDE